ncbi:hypothetical protein NC653_008029 [Populus alba x Populus x berolinensis]|uniref:Uncharacterized protein n=1 Tax=Populus alba x Populus x berolinensis TaxID=444605 RepID=A0AAD6R6K0_9ROSI|nr:hypothetical protein NC653_008029 [Populus alba x Populus x berolinensis]
MSEDLPTTQVIKAMSGLKYKGKYLHSPVKENLGNKKLHQNTDQ